MAKTDSKMTIEHLADKIDSLSTTVDDLAIITANGFQRVDKK